MKRFSVIVVAIAFLFLPFTAGLNAQETFDTAAVSRIKEEGLKRSQVMEFLAYIADVYGPRLTGSPEFKRAAEWAASKMKEMGLQNVHFDKWGPFGRGWILKRFSAHVTQPRVFPLIAYPKAWSPGTKGTITAEVVYLDAKTDTDLERYKGQLKGKIVLISEPRELKAHFQPLATRHTDSSLLRLANADMPAPTPRRPMPALAQPGPAAGDAAMLAFVRQFAPNIDSAAFARAMAAQRIGPKKLEFCQKEGAALVMDVGRGDGGTLVVTGASVPQPPETPLDQRISAYHEKAPKIIPQLTVAAEHYNWMVRMLQRGQKVKAEVNLQVEFTPVDSGFNIIGEIPGSDLKDEIVMIGAHFDSWHAATGTTDNAAGSAVCLEAMRILKKLDLKPRRTIRIALWGGEEQGLLGSRAYVSKYFAERESRGGGEIKKKADYDKFSVYFNLDNGTGKIRGVYMQGNEAARPIFRAWLAPFSELGASTLTLSNTSGTDHLAFDAVGLPGFQFIQDPLEYGTRTHHTNMDVYERAQEEDLKQAAVIMAAFAYNAAMRDQKFPRKPMPTPPTGAQ